MSQADHSTELRPLGRVWSMSAAVLLLAAASSVATGFILGSYAARVQVQVVGPAAAELRQVSVAGLRSSGQERELRKFAIAGGKVVWQVDSVLLTGLRIRLPRRVLESMQGIGIGVGLADIWFPREEVLARWTQLSAPGAGIVTLESPGREARFINWAEGASIAERLVWPAAFTALFALAALLARRRWDLVRRWLLEPEEESAPNAGWFFAGLAAVVALLAYLEWSQPYFFTQDDFRVMFLPNFAAAGRIAARGELPIFNHCEYLGSPWIDPGNFALTYPLTYVSYAVATRLLGEECLTMEVWAWLHLLLGYAACYWFAREARLGPTLAAAAAVSFITSGYLLISGRGWLGGVPLWLPLLMALVARVQRGVSSWRTMLLAALAIGAHFHAGNSQFWVYTMLVLAFAVAVAGQRWGLFAAAGALGLALVLPLMLPQLSLVAKMERQGGLGGGIHSKLLYLVLPYGAAEAVGSSGPQWPAAAKMSLPSGVALTAVGLLSMVLLAGALAVAARPRELVARNLWGVCAGFAFLLALGQEGFLWGPMSALPGFSSFSFPIKFVPYLTLFLVVSGALVVQRWKVVRLDAAIFAVVVLVSFHLAAAPITTWTEWGIKVPYERLEGLSGVLDRTQRFLPLAPRWSPRPDLVWTMFESLATYYGMLSIDGYSPFLWGSPQNVRVAERMIDDPVPALRAYGVKWVVLHDDYRPPDSSEDPTIPQIGKCSQLDSPGLLEQVRRVGRPVGRFESVTVLELPDPAPLAFAGTQALPVELASDGARVGTSALAKGGRVTVNLLRREAFRAFADGREVSVGADDWGRIEADVPAGTRELRVRYRPRWEVGLAAGLLMAIAGGVIWRRSSAGV